MVGSKEAIKTNFLTKQKTFDRHLDDPNSTEKSGDKCAFYVSLWCSKTSGPKDTDGDLEGKGGREMQKYCVPT